jgi:hypothetical protein
LPGSSTERLTLVGRWLWLTELRAGFVEVQLRRTAMDGSTTGRASGGPEPLVGELAIAFGCWDPDNRAVAEGGRGEIADGIEIGPLARRPPGCGKSIVGFAGRYASPRGCHALQSEMYRRRSKPTSTFVG